MSTVSTGQAASGSTTTEGTRPSLLKRMFKTLSLILLPIVAAAVIIGASLQVIGIPVWQTTLSYVDGQARSSPSTETQSALVQAQTDNANLTKQVTSLKAELKNQQNQVKQLNTQLSKTQAVLTEKQTAVKAAQQEASILTQMDPAAAAPVLAKLPQSEAGLVISSLTPSAASAVLAAMDPAAAAKLLELAGQSNINAVMGNSTG